MSHLQVQLFYFLKVQFLTAATRVKTAKQMQMSTHACTHTHTHTPT